MMVISHFNMITRKLLHSCAFLYKYGLCCVCKRIIWGRKYKPTHVTKLYLYTREVNNIAELPILPTFGALKVIRRIKASPLIKIYLSQIWGGGAEMYLRKQLEIEEGSVVSLLIKPFEYGSGLHVEVWQGGLLIGECLIPSLEALDSLRGKSCSITINSLVQWHLVYGRTISNDALHQTVDSILRLKNVLGASLKFLVHDYYCLCPKINLTNSNARYCGSEGDVARCTDCLRDVRSVGEMFLDGGVSVQDWRSDFSRLFESCTEVRTFSEDTCNRISGCFGNLPLTVVPHSLTVKLNELSSISSDNGIVIGVFGGIGKVKGSQEVVALARYILAIGCTDARIVVVGDLKDSGQDCPPNIKVLGGYNVSRLPEIVKRESINIGLMPSILPETLGMMRVSPKRVVGTLGVVVHR